MTSDKDLITKERAWDAVRHVFGQGLAAVRSAIKALEPMAECQDAVSRDKVRKFIENILWGTLKKKDRKSIVEAVKYIPRVLPAGRSESLVPRDEEEIRAALTTKLLEFKLYDFPAWCPFCGTQKPGRNYNEAREMLEQTIRDGLLRVLNNTFTPPKNRKEEAGGKD